MDTLSLLRPLPVLLLIMAFTNNAFPDVPEALKVKTSRPVSERMIAVKTNAVAWGATILNVEGELQLSRKFSLSVPFWYCPWFIGERRALRVAAFQPEGRWWPRKVGHGHFVGVHGSLAWYNLKWGDYRYQDQGRPLLGGGITYGYSFRFGEHWGLELSAGVGYINTRYDRFFNTYNGQLADRLQTSYFGPDHLSISLVYEITR